MRQVLIFSLLLFCKAVVAQNHQLDCSKIQTGKFYFYPANDNRSYIVLRDGRMQAEINIGTKDTTFFQVKWTSACNYELRFMRTTKTLEPRLLELFQKTTVAVEIIEINDSYYTFVAGAKDDPDAPKLTERIQFNKRDTPVSDDQKL